MPADLEKEVQDLAAHGIKEIVLVGINLSAYGKGQDFDLLDAVAIATAPPALRGCVWALWSRITSPIESLPGWPR